MAQAMAFGVPFRRGCDVFVRPRDITLVTPQPTATSHRQQIWVRMREGDGRRAYPPKRYVLFLLFGFL